MYLTQVLNNDKVGYEGCIDRLTSVCVTTFEMVFLQAKKEVKHRTKEIPEINLNIRSQLKNL